jgi:hypothetical protein
MQPDGGDASSYERRKGTVGRPKELTFPFFAYGIFRPQEIAWPRIINLVERHLDARIDDWVIRLRNGLPLLIPQNGGVVDGSCVFFSEPIFAYDVIGNSEPSGEYRWTTIKTQSGIECNVLIAEKPEHGVSHEPISSWTSAQDPSFVHGMSAVASTVTAVRRSLLEIEMLQDEPDNWDAFFQLQGSFLVLWSIVERLAAFRFGAEYVPPGKGENNTTAKIYALAEVPEFRAAVENANIREQVVYSARENKPKHTRKSGSEVVNEPVDPETALKAWYQIRSNITHRGKSAKSDNSIVLTATEDLFNVTYLYLKSVIPSIEREWNKRKLGLLPQIKS